MKVLVTDPISPKGVALLRETKGVTVVEKTKLPLDELKTLIADADALIVRSETKVTADVIAAAKKLKVVGRAGVGVDNIDAEAATTRGIIVMNSPDGNTNSTAEHAFSLLLSVARNIPQAHASVKAGEWNRKAFQGAEICGKTLGIIGMGRIGTEVCRRAIAFGLRVIAYDPFLAPSRAKTLQVELVELPELYRRADFITIHVPLTDETKGLIGKHSIAQMKPGVRIVNAARGGIVDEQALVEAIKAGKVAGAALDVFEEEPLPANSPLRAVPQIITTPHLGAATAEAQELVGVEIAQSVVDALMGGIIRNAVNMPNIDAKTLELVRPYFELAEKLGRLLAQLAPRRIERFTANYCGPVSELDTNPITRAALRGLLQHVAGKDVNVVNAPMVASNLGIKVEEVKVTAPADFTELIELRVQADGQQTSVAGTFYGSHLNPRIVRINDTHVEAVPSGVLFIMENRDRPGVVGYIGTLMGKHKINIASMSLGRDKRGGRALTILNLDSLPDEKTIKDILRDKDIYSIKLAKL